MPVELPSSQHNSKPRSVDADEDDKDEDDDDDDKDDRDDDDEKENDAQPSAMFSCH